MLIKVVSFYKDINLEQEKAKKLKARSTFDYKECQKKLFNTFKKFNNGHEFIVSTDLNTTLECYPRIDRHNLNGKLLMESVAIANNNFIQQEEGKIILLGADHLFCGNVNNFFEDDFDIGLLIVDKFDESHCTNINNTIILVNSNKNNVYRIRDFFKNRLDICLKLPLNERRWFGDQKSISLLLESKNIISNYHKNKETNIIFDHLKIKLIPWGSKYLKVVNSDGTYKKDDDDVLIDFCGGDEIKKFLNTVYLSIMES
jgi:hypothetical protein